MAKEFTNLNVTYHNYFSHAFPPSNPTLSGCPLHLALDIGVFGSNSNNTSNFLLISCSFPLLYTIITPYVRKILTFRVFGQINVTLQNTSCIDPQYDSNRNVNPYDQIRVFWAKWSYLTFEAYFEGRGFEFRGNEC